MTSRTAATGWTWIHVDQMDRLYPWGPLECEDVEEAIGLAQSLSIDSDYPGADALVVMLDGNWCVVLLPEAEPIDAVWRYHNGAMV